MEVSEAVSEDAGTSEFDQIWKRGVYNVLPQSSLLTKSSSSLPPPPPPTQLYNPLMCSNCSLSLDIYFWLCESQKCYWVLFHYAWDQHCFKGMDAKLSTLEQGGMMKKRQKIHQKVWCPWQKQPHVWPELLASAGQALRFPARCLLPQAPMSPVLSVP